MGAYLSEPITDTTVECGGNKRLRYGVASMQGWRVNQEDSHNCIIDYDRDCSFFAVYDGHGGAEVAKYTSEHLPEFIKTSEPWIKGKMEEAFIDGFLNFDDTLRSEKVIETLKQLAGTKTDTDGDSSSDVDEDKKVLYEEACMPIDQILQRYGLTIRMNKGDEQQQSPAIRKKKHVRTKDSKITEIVESHTNGDDNQLETKINVDDHDGALSPDEDEKKCKRIHVANTSDDFPNATQPVKRLKSSDETTIDNEHQTNNCECIENGDLTSSFRRHCFSESHGSNVKKDTSPARERSSTSVTLSQRSTSSTRQRNSKSESEAHDMAKNEQQQEDAGRTEMAEIAEHVATAGASRMSETPETQTAASSDDDEHSADEDYKAVDGVDEEDEENDGEEEEEENEDEDESGESSDDEEEDGEDNGVDETDEHVFPVPSGDTPGQDSGTTACVAVISGDILCVANAGDSRCVLARNGIAIDMSQDHKPEDDIEKARIEAAGGCISLDGRVNGGLNLSRALGDHFYKRNEAIALKDQMISALPDVRIEKLTNDDQFMVLACDGIWNSMTSQEVVDFISKRLASEMALPEICKQICTHCLASSTAGDGTGCDNMTVIITVFKSKEEEDSVDAPPIE